MPTTPKTYRVSPEVIEALNAAATKFGGVDRALRELLIEHPKRCQGEIEEPLVELLPPAHESKERIA